jgi:hypothetical protein
VGIAHSGDQSFRICGDSLLVRTDGVELDLADIVQLVYECAVMIPQSNSAGALFGFFVQVNPNMGEIYNGILFDSGDNMIYVRGVLPESTGFSWTRDTWFQLKVVLNYDIRSMDVWLDNQQIANDIYAADRELSNIFAVSTVYGDSGAVFYDDVTIYREEGNNLFSFRKRKTQSSCINRGFSVEAYEKQ